MARLGRQRKVGAVRHPCGKIIQRVEREAKPADPYVPPTAEVNARRKAMFGKHAPENGDAQGELECPVSILGRRLDADQRHAANKALSAYARYSMAILPPRIVAGQLRDYVQGSSALPMLPDDLEEHKAAYELLRRAVLREVKHRFRANQGVPGLTQPGAIARQAWREVHALMQRQLPRNLHALRLGLDAIVKEYDLAGEPRVVSNRNVQLEAA
jgi:hypothetical protein